MAENEEKDKSEKATPHKLEQARKKGQVAKSMEINTLVSLAIFSLLMMLFAPGIGEKLEILIKRLLIGSGSIKLNNRSVFGLFFEGTEIIFTLFAPFIIALIVLGVGVTVLQTKPVFSTEPLKPNFSKLNPVKGLKKIFAIRSLYELVKNLLRLTALGALIYWGLNSVMSDLLLSVHVNPSNLGRYWVDKSLLAAVGFVLVLLPFALFDLFFNKREFAKKMRMSKREVKEEIKRRDGDPHIKSKRKQIQNELLKKSSSISNVKDSDVIITNPTHFAVALKYVPGKMIAPIVIAKGTNDTADKIRRIALEHNIPVFRQPRLARKLFKKTKIDHPVDESTYPDVVPIIRWAFELKGKYF